MNFRQNKIVRLVKKTITYGLFCIALALIIIMYTPLTNSLSGPLFVKTDLHKVDVIVVLGGGSIPHGQLSWFSLMRTAKGVELYKGGYADKIIFTGDGNNTQSSGNNSVANNMAKVAIELGIPAQSVLIENKSKRTHEDALRTAEMMKEYGFQTALLVTSASHMKRALLCFEHAGVKVFPASVEPVEMYVKNPMERLYVFKVVMREYAGLALYKLKGWI